jgi:hypothetical protein
MRIISFKEDEVIINLNLKVQVMPVVPVELRGDDWNNTCFGCVARTSGILCSQLPACETNEGSFIFQVVD